MSFDRADIDSLAIQFFTEAKEDRAESEKLGRKVFKDVDMIRIKWVGDRGRELIAPADAQCTAYKDGVLVHTTYAEKHAVHYEKFKAGQEQIIGIPLEMMEWVTPSKRAELKAVNVRTVEQLAGMSDRDLKKLGVGYRELREEAQGHLARATDEGARAVLEARIKELEARLAAGEQTEPAADRFDGMTDEALRAELEQHGVRPRANAARDKLIEAARQMEAA